ncbi:MAG: 50S ribosomal protein L33 [Vampirovibrionales bacterium]|nr:50S ribosomal protein L33 [Vampirovibrionales bacterium]
MTLPPSGRKPRAHRASTEKLALACELCQQRNYKTPASSAAQKAHFKLRKFCPTCNQHTEHLPTR